MGILLAALERGACEDQDLAHRLYIFTAIMFMASQLQPLTRVSRDYRVKRLVTAKPPRLPEAGTDVALCAGSAGSQEM